MKTKQVTINTYEIGDVIDVSTLRAKHKKHTLDNGKRAVVIGVIELRSGDMSYDVVTDEGLKVRISPDELRGEKYIGKIDLDLLFKEP